MVQNPLDIEVEPVNLGGRDMDASEHKHKDKSVAEPTTQVIEIGEDSSSGSAAANGNAGGERKKKSLARRICFFHADYLWTKQFWLVILLG